MAPSYQRFLIYVLGLVVPIGIYLVFVGYPVAENIYLGFTRWNGLSPNILFVGVSNYWQMLSDPGFRNAFVNTVIWAALALAIDLLVGMAFAILLFSGRIYFPTLFRSLLFLPVTMSMVAVGLMYSLILSPNFGAFDQMLQAVGLGGLARTWLGDYQVTLYVLIVINAWATVGVSMMLFHAGLNNIATELFEAARLDGASERQVIRYVILPGLRPTIVIVTMLSVMRSLRTFDLVSAMTRGGPAGGTDVLGHYMYTVSFLRNQFGYGAAIAVAILILSAGLAFVYLRGMVRDALSYKG